MEHQVTTLVLTRVAPAHQTRIVSQRYPFTRTRVANRSGRKKRVVNSGIRLKYRGETPIPSGFTSWRFLVTRVGVSEQLTMNVP